MKKLVFSIMLMLITSCEYKADLGFLNSAQANYPDYLAQINGKFCVDMDGISGLCGKRIATNQDLIFKLQPKPYQYRIQFICSSKINADFSTTVNKDEEFSWKLESEVFNQQKSFTCISEIFPLDREEEVSSKFEVRVKVYDEEYIPMDKIRSSKKNGKTALTFGKHAKFTKVCVDNECRDYKQKTYIKINPEKEYFIWTESELMRNSYFGIDSLD